MDFNKKLQFQLFFQIWHYISFNFYILSQFWVNEVSMIINYSLHSLFCKKRFKLQEVGIAEPINLHI